MQNGKNYIIIYKIYSYLNTYFTLLFLFFRCHSLNSTTIKADHFERCDNTTRICQLH